MRRNVASLFKRASSILILFLGLWLLQSSSEESLVYGSTIRNLFGTRRNSGTRRGSGTRRNRTRTARSNRSGRGKAAAVAAAGAGAVAAGALGSALQTKDAGVEQMLSELYGDSNSVVKAKSIDSTSSEHDAEVARLADEFDQRVSSVCSAVQRKLVVAPELDITLNELRGEANKVSDDSYFSYSTFLRYTCGANSVFLILFGLIGLGLWLYSFVPLLVNKYKKSSDASEQDKAGDKPSESATTKDVAPGSTAIQIGNAKQLATTAKKTQYAFFVMRISALFLITVTAVLLILACSVGYTGIQSGESALCTGMETARGLFFGGQPKHSVPSDQSPAPSSLFDLHLPQSLQTDSTSGLLGLSKNITELRTAAEAVYLRMDPVARQQICAGGECAIPTTSTTVLSEMKKYLMEGRSHVEKLVTIVGSLVPLEPKVRQIFMVTETLPGLQTIQNDISRYLDLLNMQSVAASSYSEKSTALYNSKIRSTPTDTSTETVAADLKEFVSSLGTAAQALRYRGDSFYVLLPLMGIIIFVCLLVAMGTMILNWSEFAEVPLDDMAEIDSGSFVSADEVGATPKIKRMQHLKMLFIVWLILMPLSVIMFFVTAGQASFNNGLRHFCDKAANVVVENSSVSPYDSPAEMLIKSCFQQENNGTSAYMVAQKMGVSAKLHGMNNTCDILVNRVNSMIPASSVKALKDFTQEIVQRIRNSMWIVIPDIPSSDRIELMGPIIKSGIQMEDSIGEIVPGQPELILGFQNLPGRLGPWSFNLPKVASKIAPRSALSTLSGSPMKALSDEYATKCLDIFKTEEIYDTDSSGDKIVFSGLNITADWPKAGDALLTRWLSSYEQALIDFHMGKGDNEQDAVKKASDCKLVMLQSIRQASRKLRIYGSTVPITLNDKPRIYNASEVLNIRFSEPYLVGLSDAMGKLYEMDKQIRGWTDGINRRRQSIQGDLNCTSIVASYTRNIYSGCQIALPKLESAEAFMGFVSYFLSLIAFTFILFGIWWRQSMVRKATQPSDSPRIWSLLEKFKVFHVGLTASA